MSLGFKLLLFLNFPPAIESHIWLILYSFTVCRIPLIKGKTAREDLMEKGLWEEYRNRFPYNPMAKFYQTGNEAMTNDADVRANTSVLLHFIYYS